jgi:hypothetical protein
MNIKRIQTREELIALKKELGVRPDWHEPDEREVSAQVSGQIFDNAGFWGTAEIKQRRADGDPDDRYALEKWVTIYQGGKPVADVNLATLFAFATGFEG